MIKCIKENLDDLGFILMSTNNISNISMPLDKLELDFNGFDPHICNNYELYIFNNEKIICGDLYFTEEIQPSIHKANTQRQTDIANQFKSKKIIKSSLFDSDYLFFIDRPLLDKIINLLNQKYFK